MVVCSDLKNGNIKSEVEDRLDGASNFLSWKARVTLLLKENDLWEISSQVTTPLTDAMEKATYDKKEIKAQWVILDAVKDHLIPHLSEKQTTREMFIALVNLFQSDNLNRKMILRNKLRSVQMSRSDNVTSYLMRITQICDQLAAVGETVSDIELVNTTLNGFSKSWEPFVKGICAREKLPSFEKLWDDFIRRRLGRSPRLAGREVVMRTWPLSVRQERAKERVPTRRVTVRGKPHNQGRRRT
jgi:hypothetical protein